MSLTTTRAMTATKMTHPNNEQEPEEVTGFQVCILCLPAHLCTDHPQVPFPTRYVASPCDRLWWAKLGEGRGVRPQPLQCQNHHGNRRYRLFRYLYALSLDLWPWKRPLFQGQTSITVHDLFWFQWCAYIPYLPLILHLFICLHCLWSFRKV